jgi:excisionase family DNA binding protein
VVLLWSIGLSFCWSRMHCSSCDGLPISTINPIFRRFGATTLRRSFALLILSLRPLRTRHSVAQRRLRLFIYAKTRDTMRTMAHPRKYHDHVSTNTALPTVDNDKSTGADPIDPSALGFAKVAYAVDETLELLSIGRTALYAAVKRGDLKRVKFGKKTLFYAADLAAFLARLRHLSGSDESRVDRAPRQISSPKCKIDLPGS